MRSASSFVTEGDLIVIEVSLRGPCVRDAARFVLDTGAALTTIVPELADQLGYSPRHGQKRTTVRSALGIEEGYLLRVGEMTALGITMPSFVVNVFDLGYGDIDGLLGMNFLNELNYEVRSTERRILVEQLTR